MKLRDTHIGY